MRMRALAMSLLLASCGSVPPRSTTEADPFVGGKAYLSGLGGMLLGILVGAAAGGVVGRESSDRRSSSDEDHPDTLSDSEFWALMIGGAVGGSLGAASGVGLYGASALPAGQRGSFGLALLGSALSAGIGLLALDSNGPAAGYLFVAGYFVLPPLGAVLGYDAGIPNAPPPPPPDRRAATLPATGHAFMVPVVRLAFW